MQLRSLFILFTLVSISILGLLFLNMSRISSLYQSSQQKSDLAYEVSTTISQLNILSNSYVLYHEERSHEQWLKRWKKLQNLLQYAQFEDIDSRTLITSLQSRSQKIRSLFDRTVNATKSFDHDYSIHDSNINYQERALASQLLNMIFVMDNNAGQLYLISQLERNRIDDLYQRHIILIFIVMTIMLLFFLVIFFLRVVKPIQIIRGQLKSFNPEQPEHELYIKSSDEIGELVSSFNQMTRSLQTVLVSRERLQTEIDARKRTERNLDTFFDQPLHLHLVMDFNGLIHRANSAWKNALGYTVSEMEERSVSELIHPDDRQIMNDAIARLNKGISVQELELRFISQNNDNTRYLMWSASPSVDNLLIYVIATDVTDQREAHENQERLQRELYQSQKMDALGKLTGGIAHDFNNILAIVLGNVELAQDLYEDKEQSRLVSYLDEIESASVRARDLVAKMMIFSSSGPGKNHPMDLTPMINNDINMLKSLLPTSMVIDLDFQTDLPKVEMDPIKLQQMLMNLCLNAKDAMNGVGMLSIKLGMVLDIELECSSCHQQIDGDWVELSITDTGSGITPDIITHIFEPFYTTKEMSRGTGMGLAVVDGVVKSVGGHIIVQSEIAKGTTFRLLFPPSFLSDLNDFDESEDSKNTINLRRMINQS